MLKIILSGGPSSGKSSSLAILTQLLEARGYNVFSVFESSSALILNGIRPSENISLDDFQEFIIDMQIANESIFERVSQYYNPDKVIIFYDRGIMDGAAYCDKTTFSKLLKKKKLTVSGVMARYDAVFHLVTAADGAEEFYSWNDPSKDDVGNNAARMESPEEARIKDKQTLNAWIGHPHLRVFDNSTDFKGKVDRIIKEVFALLGEPVPSEIERKYLIKKPTDEQIKALGCISKTQIIQTYLKHYDDNVAERRVRQRGTKEDGFSFYYTEKTDVSSGVRVENERKISKDEYLDLLSEADTSLHQIVKTRYCFVYEKQYFEMDIYPFSDEYAIVEIELNDINENVNLPPLDFIKDVTDDKNYKNSELAKTLAFE
jgi:CYTH domain-containing protein/predicted ATPase